LVQRFRVTKMQLGWEAGRLDSAKASKLSGLPASQPSSDKALFKERHRI
jgi:hypothetical protein